MTASLSAAPTRDEIAARAAQRFRERFGRPPRYLAAAPGRVNLIGEHTDYNDGYVLPMAIERYTVLAADRRDGDPSPDIRVYSGAVDDAVTFVPHRPPHVDAQDWSRYVLGVVTLFAERGMNVGGFDAVVESDVPVGGGLSSSAALEVSTATLVEAMVGQTLEPLQKALLCQKAEHEFAGVPCGIMDQFASTFAQRDRLMLLDCRELAAQQVPLEDPAVSVLIVNSNVKHELAGGEYAQRRAQCEAAARALDVPALRDANLALLEKARDGMDPLVYRRARHVIGENARTLEAAHALAAGDWKKVGSLMYLSHQSLRDDFEVSTPELDLLVELAAGIGEAGGVIGSRMTGGGFGGCTVSLVRTAELQNVTRTLCDRYTQKIGVAPTPFATRPGEGAAVLARP